MIEFNSNLQSAIALRIRDKWKDNQHRIIWRGGNKVSFEPFVPTLESGLYNITIAGISAYTGETDVNLHQRIARWIKVLHGIEHETETHSLGNDLLRASEHYQIDPQWFVNNARFSYLPMDELRSYWEGRDMIRNTLYGIETYTIDDFTNKEILTYIESVLIKELGPVSNRNFNEYSPNKAKNINEFQNLLEKLDCRKTVNE